MLKPILLVGTLDTKGQELGFVRDLIRGHGHETLVMDVGSVGPPTIEPDIDRAEVFRASGTSWADVQAFGDRGKAVALAAQGAARLSGELGASNRISGIFGLGGSAGTEIATAAMRSLPFGLPKVMVSTLASGQTRPYVRGSDIAMFYPVADLCGLNRLTRTALANAALALVGMIGLDRPSLAEASDRPVVAATMFGVTTPCVDQARKTLEGADLEVLVFHATGIGGQSMESLIRDGMIEGVLDLTTTELADELVGGILSAGPDRLEAAGRKGIPQVVSVGALDMVNFGPPETIPEQFKGRLFHAHNPSVTLMRTTLEENRALGKRLAVSLCKAQGPVVLMIPRGGVSALDAPGRSFHDPEADEGLFSSLIEGVTRAANVRVVSRDEHINDPDFADASARALLELLNKATRG
ncbi:Tm-1-like ATP-binding domain-containing protein [Singulisphaera sp. PoT]|uniref:Tm-1-like ATP-binding domain-containing protein n=1 Tax=Singulisphaera sp. PoT TaxID=3411797 RepID=UPI003BF61350